MIKIFNENDRDFSTNGNIAINPIKCREIKKKSLNGWYIEVELNVKYKEYIEQDKLCVVKTKSKLRPQAFRIENPKITNNVISFTANHVMFDSKKYFLVDVRPTNQNGQNALSNINERTDKKSPFKVFSDVPTESTAYFIRKNLLEAWEVIEERWNGVFDADNWDISFLKKVGNDNGENVSYGKNMQGIEIFEDWSNVCTKIYPVGPDELMLDEEYLESDVQYPTPYTRTETFNSDLELDEEMTEEEKRAELIEELRKKAKEYLEENKYPKVSYEVTSNINQNMEIGDTIHVKHPLVNLLTEVLEYEHNILTGKIELLVFGNYKRDVKSKFDSIKDNINNVADQLTERLTRQDIVIKQQTDLINSLNKSGYVYIDENEILVLDALPKEKAKNVWRFGLGGIGFSSNGYEGPFELAMTMDGQINADFITTGTMSTARIEGLENTLNNYLVSIQLNSTNIEQLVGTQNSIINKFDNYTTTEDMQTLITQSADEVLQTASKTYTTKTEFTTGLETTKEDAISSAVDSANANTDLKLGNYSTTAEMNAAIDLKYNEITLSLSETYTTKSEFTAGLSSAKSDAISSAVSSANASTDSKLRNYSTTTEMNSAIKLKTDSITLEVNKKLNTSDFGTKLQLSSSDVQIAWNGISKYIQFSNGELNIYDSAVTSTQKLRAKFNYNGNHFYRDDYYVGKIGTNQWASNNSHKGLEFDLDYQGKYMSFAQKESSSSSTYSAMLTFSRDNSIYDEYGINLGCVMHMNGNRIKFGDSSALLEFTEGCMGVRTAGGFIITDTGNKTSAQFSPTQIDLWHNVDMHNWEIVNCKNFASDGRLKKSIYNSKINAIDTIKKIKHREFIWKKDGKQEKIGYIAQELEKIDPNYVSHNYKEDDNGNVIQDSYELRHSPLIATATKAVQELIEIVEEQQATISSYQQLFEILKEKLGLEKEFETVLSNVEPKVMALGMEEETIYDGEAVTQTESKVEPVKRYEKIIRKLDDGQVEFFDREVEDED